MPTIERTNRRAFTLIELLVVVAIIALLISILLPSLTCAREKARAAKCGVQLKQFGTGLQTYFTENNDWIPGVNTTGVAVRAATLGNDINTLRKSYTPVQSYDWMSPFMRYSTELGENRALRLKTLINDYACPSFNGLRIDFLWPQGLANSPDRADFTDDIIQDYAPLSYLMPAHFQWWGTDYENMIVATSLTPAGRPIRIPAMTSYDGFSTYHRTYKSRLDMVGRPADKIAVADGMRYMTADLDIDFDVDPDALWFGCFSSNGAWFAGSQAYGVDETTSNWDGSPLAHGSDAGGRNLTWSYRHGCTRGDNVTQGVRDNGGEINALFFDGHVARLGDRVSRKVDLWYPAGTYAKPNSSGLTDVDPDTVDPQNGQSVYEVQ